MNVKFENGSVPIHELRKGVVVLYNNRFYHIKSFWQHDTQGFQIVLEDDEELFEILPQEVTWLEPM
jgi:hypothetical protein